MCESTVSIENLNAIGQRDHSVTREYRIFGPPGTGKTTNVARQIERAIGRFGPSVLVTSFSRAAAAELAGYELPIDPDRIGTLHAHCWRALGRPKIAEAHVQDWNRKHPHLRITPVRALQKLEGEQPDEDAADTTRNGDTLLGELNRSRGMLLPQTSWPAAVREFGEQWQRYKQCSGLSDFCDLIETAVRDLRIAPGRPDVIFADEAQDLNPMQLRLVRQWGENAQYFVVAGDDDQVIYFWCGAIADALIYPDVPEDHKIFLEYSHRLPRRVHARATALIQQVSRKQEKIYHARSVEGNVVQLSSGSYKCPEYTILKKLTEHLKKGQTVMVLASCAYMLRPVIAILRKNGIPFHNPYRKANGFWNPLRHGKLAAADHISSLLAGPPWTYENMRLWTEWLKPQNVLRPCATSLIAAAVASRIAASDELEDLFEPAALRSLQAASVTPEKLLQWWRAHLNPEFHQRTTYPARVVCTSGAGALDETPRLVVGTIHSVKGGEADVVFLFPDLSRAGDAAYQRRGAPRDAVIRLFYVGMTRARETLYICQRESAMAATL
jgi:DNA helicase II / ATP-dependent DNA helicase PcrA